MPLTTGQSVSFYDILGPLGVGGMGEVYRARDTRLDREVAIKVLPVELADDEERLRRFEREAKTLASLNHPNVAGIHGLGQEEDVCFLALELVPGEDLAERLAGGPLPVEEALDVCRQIAEGLEAAHEAGVIHRDLKPANVRVTPDGVVKLLDFGLAKPTVAKTPGSSGSGTSTAEPDSFLMTEEGMVLGTPTYMSPEQARGKPVDRRTDIWAFGCVLYECLTGQRAFHGGTMTDVLAAILGQEPDHSLLPPLPASVRTLLDRCLAKDPRVRLRDIGEARVLLQGGGVAGDDVADPAPARPARSPLLSAIGLVVGVVLGALLLGPLFGGGDDPVDPGTSAAEAPPVRRFAQPPARDEKGKTIPWVDSMLSPDGRYLAASTENEFVIRSLDTLETTSLQLERTGLGSATWSPDSKHLAYIDGSSIHRVTPGGQDTVQLYSGPDDIQGLQGIAWLDDGRIVFSIMGLGVQILSIPETGGPATELASIGEAFTEAHVHTLAALPGGRFLAVVHSFNGNTFKVQTEGDDGLRTVFEMPGTNILTATWVPDGHLLFSRGIGEIGDELWAVALSLDPLEVTGQPFIVQGSAAGESVSMDGTLAYAEKDKGQTFQLAWWDPSGEAVPIGRSHDRDIPSAFLSADGSSVFYVVGRTLPMELWKHDLRRGVSTQVTVEGMGTMWAGTGPDGRLLHSTIDVSPTGATMKTFALPASGRGESELWLEGGVVALSDTHALVSVVSDDDLVYHVTDLETLERTPFPLEGNMSTIGGISQDGDWVLYTTEGEVFLSSFPDRGGDWQVSTEGGKGKASFSEDGSEIRFLHEQGLFRVSLQTDPEVILGTPELIGEAPDDLALFAVIEPDSDRILATRTSGSDEGNLVVVLGWAQSLGAR